MGGFGSGRWVRTGTKRIVEDVYHFDIRRLQRTGKLLPNKASAFHWEHRGRRAFSVIIRVNEAVNAVTIFTVKQGEVRDKVRELVCLDKTPCNYGGERPWWICPQCGKRVAILYSRPGWTFACRHCHRLAYAVQKKGIADAATHAVIKIRRRLGAGECLNAPILDKPKGMHRATYTQLRIKLMNAEKRALVADLTECAMQLRTLPGLGAVSDEFLRISSLLRLEGK